MMILRAIAEAVVLTCFAVGAYWLLCRFRLAARRGDMRVTAWSAEADLSAVWGSDLAAAWSGPGREICFVLRRGWRERLLSLPWRPWMDAWLYEGRAEFYEGPASTPELVDLRFRLQTPLIKRLGRS